MSVSDGFQHTSLFQCHSDFVSICPAVSLSLSTSISCQSVWNGKFGDDLFSAAKTSRFFEVVLSRVCVYLSCVRKAERKGISFSFHEGNLYAGFTKFSLIYIRKVRKIF